MASALTSRFAPPYPTSANLARFIEARCRACGYPGVVVIFILVFWHRRSLGHSSTPWVQCLRSTSIRMLTCLGSCSRPEARAQASSAHNQVSFPRLFHFQLITRATAPASKRLDRSASRNSGKGAARSSAKLACSLSPRAWAHVPGKGAAIESAAGLPRPPLPCLLPPPPVPDTKFCLASSWTLAASPPDPDCPHPTRHRIPTRTPTEPFADLTVYTVSLD
ncbi:hypothetical protein BD779DRAFT_1784785 [Infundibulicybe gibba]|nr:hypothetical protein BD779DRAFT_1784785 [Infundibulicybe gibba]